MDVLAIVSMILVISFFLWLFFVFIPFGLWISAIAANVKIGILTLIGMKLRRVKPALIVNP